MRREDFSYQLPPELIAQFPSRKRDESRLLFVDGNTESLVDLQFSRLPELLRAGDLLVFNDTQVLFARLYGRKMTGGKLEILVERILDEHTILAQVRTGKKLKLGSYIYLQAATQLMVVGKEADMFMLRLIGDQPVSQMLKRLGSIPLPPYIKRKARPLDRHRYQTVYARQPGAVAAPTAGLHFTEEMLNRLPALGINIAFITLHVGSATFRPVREQNIERHKMHNEYFEVTEAACEKIKAATQRGHRVIAVGTTVLRCLETLAQQGTLGACRGETNIFIYPGFRFKLVDALITNFHLPESTLLMLVSAFAGQQRILLAYRHAIQQRYRFFSYGDAMFITRRINGV